MKAVLLKAPKDFSIEEIDNPILHDDEVLIRIKTSGICTNDIRDFKGDCNYSFPRIGGHEYCGVIEALGKGINPKHFAVGQRVVSYMIEDCKECYYCKRGEENICEGLPMTKSFQNPNGISGYGGFSEFVVAKSNDVFVFHDSISFEKMAFTEPLACVVNSINHTNIQLGDDVLVVGGGTMGLLHVLIAKRKGARVFLSEPLVERRKKAMALGCSYAFSPIEENPIEKIKELTQGRGANVVFNTTAIAAIAEQSVEMTAPNGTCVMFSSIHPNDLVGVNMGTVHSYQKTITGTVSPTIASFHQAVMMIDKGIVDPSVLIEKIFDYNEFGDAMATAMKPDTYKVMIKFGEI